MNSTQEVLSSIVPLSTTTILGLIGMLIMQVFNCFGNFLYLLRKFRKFQLSKAGVNLESGQESPTKEGSVQ